MLARFPPCVVAVSRDPRRDERRRATVPMAPAAAPRRHPPAAQSSRPSRAASAATPAPPGGPAAAGSAMEPTITGVPRPIASATTASARLSAMPCASLLSELKLHGANSTTPRGGRGRMTTSKYDFDNQHPFDRRELPRCYHPRGVWRRQRDDGRKAEPDQPAQQLGTPRRRRRAAQHQVGDGKTLAASRAAGVHLLRNHKNLTATRS